MRRSYSSAERPAPRGGPSSNGASRTRTDDLLGAIQALSQLSYSPGPRASLASGRSGRPRVLAHEPALADRPLHLLGLFAVPGPVLELDRRIEPLAGVRRDVLALALPVGAGCERVVDAHVPERFLDLPAGMPRNLDPLVRAAVEGDCHGATIRRR